MHRQSAEGIMKGKAVGRREVEGKDSLQKGIGRERQSAEGKIMKGKTVGRRENCEGGHNR